MTVGEDRVRRSFELQVGWCRDLGSPLYADLLSIALGDYDADGPVRRVVGSFSGDPVSSALALRFMGGLHRLVLMGVAPGLARHYPSVGGMPDDRTLADDLVATVAEHHGYLTDALDIAPQTNEVGRSMVLLPGLLSALDGGRHAVRLLGIGAAGGLNLLLDRFHYRTDTWEWGDPDSPVRLQADWMGPAPPAGRLDVVERRGCDLAPIDVTGHESELRLLSFVWADQVDRIERIRGAISIARNDPPVVDRAGASGWLTDRLEQSAPRRTLTVVQHSIMWQYVDAVEQEAITTALEAAGARATRSRPLAHLSFEPAEGAYAGSGPQVRLRSWPGGTSRVLAHAHPHGAWVRWNG